MRASLKNAWESVAVQTTREHILNILKEQGQATVGSLSRALGLTAVTVRHHLDILRGEGLVAAPIAHRRKTPGRPQYVYTLTEKASSFFPKRYEHLASLMLDELRTCLSPAKVSQLMERIGERIASQATLPTKGSDFETQLVIAVEFLNKLGYMAHWERRDDGDYLLHIANCPYEKVSSHDQEICNIDLSLLTHLLGTPPQRISWSAQGDSKCTYVVRAPGA
jgi:predicted ArsR family transcriptional regulator